MEPSMGLLLLHCLRDARSLSGDLDVLPASVEGDRNRNGGAIGPGRCPAQMPDDEALLHNLCIELHRDRGIADATWIRAVDRLGERGVVDLVGMSGPFGRRVFTP
jgi:hypothetical protein